MALILKFDSKQEQHKVYQALDKHTTLQSAVGLSVSNKKNMLMFDILMPV